MHFWGIDELGEAIRSRAVSPVEVLDATLDRIEQYDPVLRSYAHVSIESARAAAQEAERAVQAGEWRGPLHGVPIAVKDLYGTADAPTSFGSAHLKDHRIPDAEAVRRLRSAGAVIVGKLRMSEAALTDHGPGLPVPLNPWDDETWVGTSSSGSAAATAAGLCYGSLGSDTGGSIRGPATATGLTGMKPTAGAVSGAGALPLSRTLDTVGPFTRSARDCRIVLRALVDDVAPYPPAPLPRAGSQGASSDVRIGVDRHLLDSVSTDVRSMIERTADIFAELGAAVIDVVVPDGAPLATDWVAFVGAEAVRDLAGLYPDSAAGEFGEEIAYVLERGRAVSEEEVERIRARMRRYRADLDAVLGDVDALLLPTISTASPTVDEVARMRLSYDVWNREVMRLTCPMNFSGHPALTFPTGFTDWGTPVGAQLVGPHGGEPLLLALGEEFQQATDFHRRRPPRYP